MKKWSSSRGRKFKAIFAWPNSYLTENSRWVPLDSLATVLLLPKPWFRFSTRTSSVAELDLHLVAFTKNLKLFCCSVSWREPFCLTEYLRGRSKIRVFILATERNQ